MRDLGAGGAGSLPARLERDGHRGGPGRAVDALVFLRSGGSSGHDAGAVEAAISLDQHDLAKAGSNLDAATSAEEASRDLHAVGPKVAAEVGPRDRAASGHRLCFRGINLPKSKLRGAGFLCKPQLVKKARKHYLRTMIDAVQCRAARALLDWTQADLSTATGLSKVTLRAFEKGGEMRDSNRTLLRLAFEKAGVEFIDQNGGGPGVRLRDPIGGIRQEP